MNLDNGRMNDDQRIMITFEIDQEGAGDAFYFHMLQYLSIRFVLGTDNPGSPYNLEDYMALILVVKLVCSSLLVVTNS